MEFSVAVISTCGKEVIKNFVGSGCANQFGNRNSHILCIVSGKNIAEVACWDINIDWIAVFDLVIMYQCRIGINIINNLRNKSSDVDGVGG